MLKEKSRRPTHPGAILREDILPAANITQTRLAELLGTSRRSVNLIVNEQKPVTTDMALRLAAVFGNSAQFWLNLQQAVDVYEAQNQHSEEYKQIKPLAAAG
jgi:antitoxin HigA-1